MKLTYTDDKVKEQSKLVINGRAFLAGGAEVRKGQVSVHIL